MAKMMEIVFQATIKKIPFNNDEDAQIALNEIASKIGRDFYDRNKKETDNVHIIKSAMGDTAVVLSGIYAVGLINYDEWYSSESTKSWYKGETNKSISYINNMKDAGLSEYLRK